MTSIPPGGSGFALVAKVYFVSHKSTTAANDWLAIARASAWMQWAKNAKVSLIGAIAGLAIAPFAPPSWSIPLSLVSLLSAAIGLGLALRPTAEEARKIAPGVADNGPAANAGAMPAKREVLERVGNGRFELFRLISSSEQGEFFEGHDTRHDRAVALQKLPASIGLDPSAVTRLTQAIQAVTPLHHAAVLQSFEVLSDGKDVYVVTAAINGEDLKTKIARDGRFSPRTAIPLGRQLAEGLAAAHARNIFHADINPLHVILDAEGHAQLSSFGLAGLQARQLPAGGTVTGSPTYTSPEQAQGKPADARSDVYSFGIMLYHMLTGRPPFEGDAGDVLARHVTDRVPTLPDVPADLDTLLHKCTHPEPARRYPDGAALVTAFRRLQGEIA